MRISQFTENHVVLAVVMAVSFLTAFMGSAVNLAIPAIGAFFNSNAFSTSWVVTAFLLASTALLLPMGRLGDIAGKRKVFIVGICAFAVSTLCVGLAWSLTSLIVFRICQGVAGSMIFSTGIAIVSLAFLPTERGQAMGMTVAAVYSGLSVGPVLGGFLNHAWGWRSIFFFTAVVSAVAAVLAIRFLQRQNEEVTPAAFDFVGSLYYVVAITAILFGFSSAAASTWAWVALLGGSLLLAVFFRYEAKQVQPILNVTLFRHNVAFVFSNIAAMINYSATFGVGFLLSLYLQVIAGLNSQAAGLILLAQPLVMAVGSPFAGRLSDRMEARTVASVGMAFCAVGLFGFIFLTMATPIWLIIVNLMVIGLGFALFASPNNNAIMGAVEKKDYGVAASILSTMRMIGQSTSMAAVTLLLSIYTGNSVVGSQYQERVLASIHTAFLVFAIVCVLGIFASLARGGSKAQ